MKVTLKAARVNVGLNLDEAAKLLKKGRKTVWSWENGKTSPKTKDIPNIEQVYNCKYEDLIFLP